MTLHTDSRLTDAPMTQVRCGRCAAEVLVRKSSWNQTSVQWDARASAGCVERSDIERLAAGAGQGVFLTCSALCASITDAVRRGRLLIVDETLTRQDKNRRSPASKRFRDVTTSGLRR